MVVVDFGRNLHDSRSRCGDFNEFSDAWAWHPDCALFSSYIPVEHLLLVLFPVSSLEFAQQRLGLPQVRRAKAFGETIVGLGE